MAVKPTALTKATRTLVGRILEYVDTAVAMVIPLGTAFGIAHFADKVTDLRDEVHVVVVGCGAIVVIARGLYAAWLERDKSARRGDR